MPEGANRGQQRCLRSAPLVFDLADGRLSRMRDVIPGLAAAPAETDINSGSGSTGRLFALGCKKSGVSSNFINVITRGR